MERGLTRIGHCGECLTCAKSAVGKGKGRISQQLSNLRKSDQKESKHQLNIHMKKSTPIGSAILLPLKSGCADEVLVSFWRGHGRCAAVAARAIT